MSKYDFPAVGSRKTHLIGKAFYDLGEGDRFIADMGGHSDCLCTGCGLCKRCRKGKHLWAKRETP